MKSRRSAFLGVVVAALVVSGCAQPVPTSRPVSTPLTLPPGTAGPTLPPHVASRARLGATDAAWEATHSVDTRYSAGNAYDPTPGLGPDESSDDAYFLVLHSGGRVISYTERIAKNASIAEARQAALAELPADAKLLWFATRDTCAQEEFQSRSLAKLFGISDPAGDVFVEFSTETAAGAFGYTPRDANQLFFSLDIAAKAADAPAC